MARAANFKKFSVEIITIKVNMLHKCTYNVLKLKIPRFLVCFMIIKIKTSKKGLRQQRLDFPFNNYIFMYI